MEIKAIGGFPAAGGGVCLHVSSTAVRCNEIVLPGGVLVMERWQKSALNLAHKNAGVKISFHAWNRRGFLLMKLTACTHFFAERAVGHWNKLLATWPGHQACPKERLDDALGRTVQCRAVLPGAGSGTRRSLGVPSNWRYSMVGILYGLLLLQLTFLLQRWL